MLRNPSSIITALMNSTRLIQMENKKRETNLTRLLKILYPQTPNANKKEAVLSSSTRINYF
jgi:hypothetical protein